MHYSGTRAVFALIPAAHLGEKTQDLKIEPDQRDHHAEGAVPLHIFGSAVVHASLDEVKVEDQIQRGDGDDEEAEDDADEAGAVDGSELDAKEAEHHLEQIENHDSASSGDDAEAKLFSDLDDAGAIGQEKHEEGAKGEADGLDSDAGIANVKYGRDAAEEETLQQRIDWRCDRRPLLLENGDHGTDEAAKDADEQQRSDVGRIVGLQKQAPGPGRGGENANEQDAGLVDGAAQSHAGGGVNDATILAAGKALKGFVAEGRIGSLHQGHGAFSVLQSVAGVCLGLERQHEPLVQF